MLPALVEETNEFGKRPHEDSVFDMNVSLLI